MSLHELHVRHVLTPYMHLLGLAWDNDTGLAILPVKHSLGTVGKPVGVYLRRVGPDLFVRAQPQKCPSVKTEVVYTEFTAVKSLTTTQAATSTLR